MSEQPRPDVAAALRASPYFAELAADVLNRIAADCDVLVLAPDTGLYRPGERPQYLYLLLSGRVALRSATVAGEEIMLMVSDTGGAMFGVENVVADMPYLGTMRSFRSTATVLRIPGSALFTAIAECPAVSLHVATDIARRVYSVNEQATDLGLLNVPRRLAKYLALNVDPVTQIVQLGMNQQELAIRLAASRQAVNNAFTSFARRKAVIPLERGLYKVLDLEYLRSLAHLPPLDGDGPDLPVTAAG